MKSKHRILKICIVLYIGDFQSGGEGDGEVNLNELPEVSVVSPGRGVGAGGDDGERPLSMSPGSCPSRASARQRQQQQVEYSLKLFFLIND